jgi:hypothetical protein
VPAPAAAISSAVINAVTGRTLTLADTASTSVTNTDVGNLEDPTSVGCAVTTPTGDITNPGTVRDGVGQYHANYTTTEPGVHRYEFVGTGAASAVVVGEFDVTPSDTATLSARALCTLGELKQFMGNMGADDDGNLIAAINAASAKIHRVADREFVARNAVRDPTTGIVTVAAAPRRFPSTARSSTAACCGSATSPQRRGPVAASSR